jgi:hypothetical protein
MMKIERLDPPNLHYQLLQQRFVEQYQEIFFNDLAEKTVVVIPSLTLDQKILKTLQGAQFYEERLLCLLMLLRMPRTRVIYVTSMPIDEIIIDYYLHLLPGVTGFHARQRLTLLSCYDASQISLTEKILARPRLIQRIKTNIKGSELTHLVCFNETKYEQQLALALDIPVYGCDPALFYLGTKTGSRRIFKKLNLNLPEGIENIHSEAEIASALLQLKRNKPELQKAVIKMNDGFSGDGNAIFRFPKSLLEEANPLAMIQERLAQQTKIVADGLDYDSFMQKFQSMGGIVEEFIEGQIKESPSVQLRINPLGESEIISTHDQVLGGESGQVFLGASFPANPEYTYEIAAMGKKVADELQQEGVLGRFGIDFISVKEGNTWKHYAIEINLRKGGTTHPFVMLQFLTDGVFDWQKGIYQMPNGQTRCYFASDNVVNEHYKGLCPQDLIDIAHCNRIQYDGATQCGVTFHMIGALSQYGKLGMVCIGRTVAEAQAYFDKTIEILDQESARF